MHRILFACLRRHRVGDSQRLPLHTEHWFSLPSRPSRFILSGLILSGLIIAGRPNCVLASAVLCGEL